MNGNKNSPEATFKAGGIRATVWRNQTQYKGVSRDVLKIQLEKSYKDKDGNWQKTNSMTVNEIAKARHVLQQAFEYMIEKGNANVQVQQPAQVQPIQPPQPQVGGQHIQPQQPVQTPQIPPTGAVPVQAQGYGNNPQQVRNAFAGVQLDNVAF